MPGEDDRSMKASEEIFRLVVENAQEAIMIAQDGVIRFVNPAAVRFVSTQGSDIVGRPILDFIHPEDQGMVVERHYKRLSGEEVSPEYSFRLVDNDGGTRWVELKAVLTTWGGAPAVMNFLTDITGRKQAEKVLEQSYEKLKQMIDGIVDVVALTVETRDPYTAGHQRHVRDLAVAIAEGMGLEKERIEGIRVAGQIHDVGKISVPAEILVKPGRLSEVEFMLIKNHPVVGYEILKEIEFPWPVAQTIHQHHERLDGSGYPRGLRGEEILLEAKIIGVADVVEAMASHRPYRPALGIDAALLEISDHTGTRYDPDVVANCISLIKEKGYELDARRTVY